MVEASDIVDPFTEACRKEIAGKPTAFGIAHRGKIAGRLVEEDIDATLGKEYPEDDKRDEAAKQAKELSAQLKTLGVPFALAPGKSESTDAWKIGEKDTLTVVFYREMKVLQKWTFTAEKPLGEDDVKTISTAVEKELRAKK